MISCEETCGKVYVGHSKHIPRRMEEHAASVHRRSLRSYSVGKHTRSTGHIMNTHQPHIVYKSESQTHRLIVESCLLKLSNIIPDNTSSSFSRDIDLLAPKILKGAPLDWEIVSIAQPSFDQRAVPKKHRRFFSSNNAAASVNAGTQPDIGNNPVSDSIGSDPRRQTCLQVNIDDLTS